jgi:hypothetical protein
VEQFKYLGITIKNQEEQIELRKCLLPFGAEYLVSSLVSKNISIQVHRAIVFPAALHGHET